MLGLSRRSNRQKSRRTFRRVPETLRQCLGRQRALTELSNITAHTRRAWAARSAEPRARPLRMMPTTARARSSSSKVTARIRLEKQLQQRGSSQASDSRGRCGARVNTPAGVSPNADVDGDAARDYPSTRLTESQAEADRASTRQQSVELLAKGSARFVEDVHASWTTRCN